MIDKLIKVLLVEDTLEDANLLREALAEAGTVQFNVTHVERLKEALDYLSKEQFDVVLLDLFLPDSYKIDTFIKIHIKEPGVPIIILTILDDEEAALETMRQGAQDYLVKGQIESNLLVRSIRYAIERKLAQRMLEEYIEKLKEANRLKGLFTDIICHDLLEPAIVARNLSEILLETEMEKEKKENIQIIRQSSLRIIEIIENVAKYSNLEAAVKVEYNMLDLNSVLEKCIENFKHQLEEKKMKIDYLPEGKYPICVNPMMIKDLFSNLISNAIKYSPDGSRIEVGIQEKSDKQIVYVKDFSNGISDENKRKLFIRFERLGKESSKGTGLGLAIAKQIVNLHKGEIWVEDNPEGGSIFYVSLPINLNRNVNNLKIT